MAKKKITVQGLDITILETKESDFISITDIAKKTSEQEPKFLIRNWLQNSSTLEFLDVWESLHNDNFKGAEMSTFRLNAMSRTFSATVQKYIEQTGAIGIISKSGRYGGTWAHQDIAFNFAYWLSPSFQV